MTNRTMTFLLFFINILFSGLLAIPIDESHLDKDYSIDSDLDSEDNYYYDADNDDQSSMFPCLGAGYSIELSYLCDDHSDCPDGSDEVEETCMLYQKTNDVDSSAFVDPPLVKTTDEFDVDYEVCGEDEFECSLTPGLCVPKVSKCDGESDCPDGEDELFCGEKLTQKPSAAPPTTVADSTVITTTVVTTQQPSTIAVEKNTASSLADTLQTDTTISDQSTVSVLNTTQSAVATSTIMTATNSSTTTNDGSSNTDVELCDLELEFQCRTNPGDCVPRILLCDGFLDCADGSDEIECGCGEGEYQCISGKCISANYRCDGFNDCGDYSDEIVGCTKLPVIGKERTTAPAKTTNQPEILVTQSTPSTELSTGDSSTNQACGEITNICDENVCRNGGTCHLRDKMDFVCFCPAGYSGTLCHIANHCTKDNLRANSGVNHSSSLKSIEFLRTVMFAICSVLILFQHL